MKLYNVGIEIRFEQWEWIHRYMYCEIFEIISLRAIHRELDKDNNSRESIDVVRREFWEQL